jgi:hypothetical protein
MQECVWTLTRREADPPQVATCRRIIGRHCIVGGPQLNRHVNRSGGIAILLREQARMVHAGQRRRHGLSVSPRQYRMLHNTDPGALPAEDYPLV